MQVFLYYWLWYFLERAPLFSTDKDGSEEDSEDLVPQERLDELGTTWW